MSDPIVTPTPEPADITAARIAWQAAVDADAPFKGAVVAAQATLTEANQARQPSLQKVNQAKQTYIGLVNKHSA